LRSPSPYLLLVLTTLFWSGNFVLGRAVRLAVPPLGLSFWRWAVALLMLLPFAWPHLRRQWPVLRRAWRILVLLGVVGVANFNTFVYLGLQSTTATNAVLIVSTTPVIIVALSRLILAEPVGGHQAMGILISLAGAAQVAPAGSASARIPGRHRGGGRRGADAALRLGGAARAVGAIRRSHGGECAVCGTVRLGPGLHLLEPGGG
jgi:drug/metabolite transporter (DMT)-like permease